MIDLDESTWATVRFNSTPTFSRFNSESSPDFTTRITSLDTHAQASNTSSPGLFPSTLADSKSHHRQTSIVHGIQHSRNNSFASSSNIPLSPQIIAAAGRPDASNMAESPYASSMSGMNSGASFSSSSSTVIAERHSSATDNSNYNATMVRVERKHSSRSSRDHRHHHSHSRHHHNESKTVGEYALHVLFTSVSSSIPVCVKSVVTLL